MWPPNIMSEACWVTGYNRSFRLRLIILVIVSNSPITALGANSEEVWLGKPVKLFFSWDIWLWCLCLKLIDQGKLSEQKNLLFGFKIWDFFCLRQWGAELFEACKFKDDKTWQVVTEKSSADRKTWELAEPPENKGYRLHMGL